MHCCKMSWFLWAAPCINPAFTRINCEDHWFKKGRRDSWGNNKLWVTEKKNQTWMCRCQKITLKYQYFKVKTKNCLSLNRVKMLWDIIFMWSWCSFVFRILPHIWHFVELFFTMLNCMRHLCLRTGVIRYGQQVCPKNTEITMFS